MSFSIRGRFREHVRFLRRQFLQDGELPFTDVLSDETVTQALAALNNVWLDRIYSPLVTLWVFLGQVLSQDHSCRAAVARLIAHRISRAQRPCSAETGAYCQARKRLPEEFFASVARNTGQALDNSAKQHWLWKGRRVLAYDGSTVSMPDTAENQQAYPQPPQQQSGLGFPLARMAVFFSLSCGAVIDLAICRYAGKRNSELGMLRQLWDILRPGDIMLADRYMCAWHEIYLLKHRGIDSVTRLHHCRRSDFRRGKRLGKGDHIVEWPKPALIRSMNGQDFKALPELLTIRETRVQVRQPGFRCRSMIVVSLLLDAEAVTASDLAELYRARWNTEVSFHDSKTHLGFEEPQGWTRRAAERTAPVAMLLYSLIVKWFASEGHRHYRPLPQSWYADKPHASFTDMLATLRRRSLYEQTFAWGLHGPGSQKILQTLEHILALAA